MRKSRRELTWGIAVVLCVLLISSLAGRFVTRTQAPSGGVDWSKPLQMGPFELGMTFEQVRRLLDRDSEGVVTEKGLYTEIERCGGYRHLVFSRQPDGGRRLFMVSGDAVGQDGRVLVRVGDSRADAVKSLGEPTRTLSMGDTVLVYDRVPVALPLMMDGRHATKAKLALHLADDRVAVMYLNERVLCLNGLRDTPVGGAPDPAGPGGPGTPHPPGVPPAR